MLAQAGVQPAMRVLQVGTCGCTAALLAEATGPHGRVVSADPDPEVTARARAALNAAGYGQRVTLVTAAPGHGVPGHAPFDAIIVTGSVQDIEPCWTRQLGPCGTLVVPLRLNGVTRLAGLRRAGGHLASTSLQACDLSPAHWAGEAGVRAYALDSPRGGQVRVQFEDGTPGGFEVSCRALGSEPTSAWPGVNLASGEDFADLPLWLAGRPGYCQVSTLEGAVLGAGLSGWWGRDWYPSGITRGESVAILGLRPASWTSPVTRELGAWAYGPDARQAADDLATEILAWDQRGRSLPETALVYWPRGASPGPASPGSVVFEQAHGTTTITWPAGDRSAPGRN
jgi:protein-L-isoaspartate(D-aspartate) O-methyltransferase